MEELRREDAGAFDVKASCNLTVKKADHLWFCCDNKFELFRHGYFRSRNYPSRTLQTLLKHTESYVNVSKRNRDLVKHIET